MKSSSPSKRVSTRGKKMHRAIVRKQSERDQKMQRIHDDLELAIEHKDVDVVEMPPEKAVPSGLRQHVTKAGHVSCQGCKREKARGDGLSFHFCPNGKDVDVVEMPPEKAISSGLRQHVTKAGHVSCQDCKRDKARGDGLGFHFRPNGKDVDVMEMPTEKAIPSGLRQHVTKAGHVSCQDCKREKARGDGLGFHFCPNDEVIVGFRTKAGPITRPSA